MFSPFNLGSNSVRSSFDEGEESFRISINIYYFKNVINYRSITYPFLRLIMYSVSKSYFVRRFIEISTYASDAETLYTCENNHVPPSSIDLVTLSRNKHFHWLCCIQLPNNVNYKDFGCSCIQIT